MKKISAILGNSKIAFFLRNKLFRAKYNSSSTYWEKRYATNGNSGNGSYGKIADYKASIINEFVEKTNSKTVIEFGCGDGNQLKYLHYKNYIGYDVSPTSIANCKKEFANDSSKQFFIYDPFNFNVKNKADITLSLDVIYHLVEDEIYYKHMQHLFGSSQKYIVIYAWDMDAAQKQHVRLRKFSKWIEENEPGWKLLQVIPSPPEGYCDFFMYEKVID